MILRHAIGEEFVLSNAGAVDEWQDGEKGPLAVR